MNSIARFVLLSAVAVSVLTGCKKDKPEDQITQAVNLDAELRNVLESASNGEGMNFFILPESNQYSLIPQDHLNPINSAKVELGKLLFHETGIGLAPKYDDMGTATYSCASCHHAQAGFQANLRQGIGEGGIGFGIAGEGRQAHPAYPVPIRRQLTESN